MEKQSKIKLIQVIADSAIGGGPTHVLGLLKKINKEKFDLLLVAPRGWLSSEATKINGVKVKIVEFKSKWDLSSLGKLKRDIAEFRAAGDPFAPIIIHAHGPRAGSFCRLALRPGERFFYTEHIWSGNYHLQNPLNSVFQKFGLRSIYKRADHLIAVSKSVKRFMLQFGIAKGKIVVIPNAIEIDSSTGHAADHTGLMIGTIGALNKQKGQTYLIQAFKKLTESLPKARLEIIGDGSEREKLLADINELDLESRVQLLGKIDKPRKYLESWDLFVLPSLSETFGLVILEAFAAGVPVVASDVGGISELITNGKNGYLVPPADSEKLAKAVSHLLVEKKARESLTQEASKTLKEKYDWSKIILEIEREYEEAVK